MRGAISALALVLAVAAPATPGHSLSRTFLCFFEYDSASPTPRCQEIVLELYQQWAEGYRTNPGLRIEIQGHADAEEDARKIAPRLSTERAYAVAALFRQLGVPESAFMLRVYSADRMLTPTERDGPRSQNRRVELILRWPNPRPPPDGSRHFPLR